MIIQDRPLWGAAELARVTGGSWLRAPGAAWAPACVRSTSGGVLKPEWLRDGIVLFASEEHLARWFGSAQAAQAAPEEAGGCIVVEEGNAGSVHLPRDRSVLVVADTKKALRALAVEARRRLRGRVAVVTGTVGKTTTLSMLASLLGPDVSVPGAGEGKFRVHALQRMASVPPKTPYVLFEAGLGGPKDTLRDVSRVLRPDVVVITGLGADHLATITSEPLDEPAALKAVANQKLQLTEHMAADGTVVLNGDVPVHDHVARRLGWRRIVTFGTGDRAAYRLVDAEWSESRTRVRAQIRRRLGSKAIEYDLPMPGSFMAVNSLGALAAAAHLGPKRSRSVSPAPLAGLEPTREAPRLTQLTVQGGECTFIDGSLEATPSSMRSALALLQQLEPDRAGGRRIAVLGPMAELAPGHTDLVGARLAAAVRDGGIDRVYTLGEQLIPLREALAPSVAAGHFETGDELAAALLEDAREGDLVLVKAAPRARFDRIINLLRDMSRLAPTQPDGSAVPLVSPAAAAGLGRGAPRLRRDGDLPRLSWLCSVSEAGTQLLVGDDVEEIDGGIVEGAWDRPFSERRPDLAEHLFGSGVLVEEDRLVVLTPKHSLDGVFVLEHKPSGRLFVSNSLPFAVAAAGVRLERSLSGPSIAVAKGFHKYKPRLLETPEVTVHKLVYYNYAIRPDGSAVRLQLPPAAEFDTFDEYRSALTGVLEAVVDNAGNPERRNALRPLTTVSAGYDSAACAALARDVGCTEAATIRTARRGLVDSGRPVAEALGLRVIERDRPVLPEQGDHVLLTEQAHRELAAEFLATGMGGDDLIFKPFEDIFPGTVLFTGFHGDKMWDPWAPPSTDAKRGDVSGSSMSEFRMRLGFVNLPVPFVLVRSQPDVRRLSRSREMKPWSIGGPYDRPVPRRLAEDAGVPREAFGQRKMASCFVLFDELGAPSVPALKQLAGRYAPALEKHAVVSSGA